MTSPILNASRKLVPPSRAVTTEYCDNLCEISQFRHLLSSPRTGDHFSVEVPELNLPRGSIIGLRGPSGSGKTTLLMLLGLVSVAVSSGLSNFVYRFTNPRRRKEAYDVLRGWQTWRGRRRMTQVRRRDLGFCCQRGELLARRTVLENVALPLEANGWPRRAVADRVRQLLLHLSGSDSTKLWLRQQQMPGHLSGGEYQRVALARSIAHRPQLLLLDEPNSALNEVLARQTLRLMVELQQQTELTVVFSSHSQSLLDDFCNYQVELTTPDPSRGVLGGYSRRMADGNWIDTNANWQSIQGEGSNQR